MKMETYLHNTLMKKDDFYRSLDKSERVDYLKEFANTLIGLRTRAEFYIDKYIRRVNK